MFHRRRDPDDYPNYPTALEQVQAAAAKFEDARRERDAAIINARRDHSLAEIADAADLSVPRIQQIAAKHSGDPHHAHRPTIPAIDLPDAQHDYPPILAGVAPDLPQWRNEEEFIAADHTRQNTDRYDLAWCLFDDDPTERWVGVHIPATTEVYVFRHVPGANEGHDVRKGSRSGPCILLGHAPSYELVRDCVWQSAQVAQYRLGGLAWLYSRVQLLNVVAQVIASPVAELTSDALADYLRALPDRERQLLP